MNKFLSITLFLLSSYALAQLPSVSKGKMVYFKFQNSNYIDQRTIAIWLPENYNTNNKYQVVYMHDAQTLFDTAISWNHQSWEVDENLQQLIDQKKVKNTLVVGIYNAQWKRRSEFFPQKALSSLTKNMLDSLTHLKDKNDLLVFSNGFTADNYLKFIVEELKPYVDSAYATLTDAEHTFIAGSSMGALISLYALCEYPNVFGGAACLSTHWTGAAFYIINELSESLHLYFKQYIPDNNKHKIYFDYGTVGLDSLYKPYQNKMDDVMRSKNYDNKHWITKEFVGAAHDEKSWRERLNIPLEFLLKK
jgi:predicted alpha/beta superfamily hydrolase